MGVGKANVDVPMLHVVELFLSMEWVRLRIKGVPIPNMATAKPDGCFHAWYGCVFISWYSMGLTQCARNLRV